MTKYIKHIIKAAMIFMTAFIFSCSYKEDKENGKNNFHLSAKPKIEVRLIGEVSARRSYAHIQFIHGGKAIDSYLEKQTKTNPTLGYQPDSISQYLITQFQKLGLKKNGELILKNFKKQTDEQGTYTDSSGRQVSLLFYINQLTGHYNFKLLSATDSVDIDTGGTNLQDLDYAFIDIINGGNKELVYLNDYYIMNGDNFDFMIYEIKINYKNSTGF